MQPWEIPWAIQRANVHSVINWSNDIFIIHSKWTDISWIQEVLGEESRIAYIIPSQASSNLFFYFPYCILLLRVIF